MAKIRVCEYLDFAIEVDSETGAFSAPAMQLEKSSLTTLKAAIRDESKARGLFKPFLLVERGNPANIFGKCVNKDARGYRLESGQYVSSYLLGKLVRVPDTYLEDVKGKLGDWEAKRTLIDALRSEAAEACNSITSGYPTLNVEKV